MSDEADLDALIRTGLTDSFAIDLAKNLLEEAEIPFFAMDLMARHESGPWWSVRVPREREAEAREILLNIEKTK